MPKKIVDISNINIELQKFESKLSQFQTYLEQNSIVTQVTKDDKILLADEDQDKLHKEIIMQIKMQDSILGWLPLLKKLKEEQSTKTVELRGGQEANGLFESDKNR